MLTNNRFFSVVIITTTLWYWPMSMVFANSAISNSLMPGEKLTYALSWENIPAGELQLEIKPVARIDNTQVFHFVMTVQTNSMTDLFCKIRDRFDAYADLQMTRSIFFKKGQTGDRKRQEIITFDWKNNIAHYSDSGAIKPPLQLRPGSFDPLSAFYFTRIHISEQTPKIERFVTDGKDTFISRATFIRRESITLSNGRTYDTLCFRPELMPIDVLTPNNNNPQLNIWVTADKRRLPIQIIGKVKVGSFIGELIAME